MPFTGPRASTLYENATERLAIGKATIILIACEPDEFGRVLFLKEQEAVRHPQLRTHDKRGRRPIVDPILLEPVPVRVGMRFFN